MSMKFFKPLFLIFIIFLAVTVNSGCSPYKIRNSSSGFKFLTVNDGIGKFSLEFNDRFKLNNHEITDSFSSFSLDGPYTGVAQDFTFISIDISNLDPGQPSYIYYLEESLKWNKNLPNIKVVERFPVLVARESGEEVVCYYDAPRVPLQIAKGIPSAPSIIRRVMFTHNNLLWQLEMRGLESSAEQDKIDFEHVAQSFKILN
jgi:hypothetical protein